MLGPSIIVAVLEIEAEVLRLKPNLKRAWWNLRTKPLSEIAVFLDKHFPIQIGWGSVQITETPRLLRLHYGK